MFGNVNLKDALQKERKRVQGTPDYFVEAAKQLLEEEFRAEQQIISDLNTGAGERIALAPEGLDPERVFSLDEIRSTCVKYRLRFLDTKYFSGEIPYDAMVKIKELKRETSTNIDHFRIMAPAKMFELDDCNTDPLLFAPLTNGQYYLIHQWGNDMKWHRKLLAFPFRKRDTLMLSIMTCAALLSLLIPSSALAETAGWHVGNRFVLFLWAMITLSAVATYVFFTFNKNFSNTEWNSRYFNS